MPRQDWSFVEESPETYPGKSPGKWGGHLKQVVAISANQHADAGRKSWGWVIPGTGQAIPGPGQAIPGAGAG